MDIGIILQQITEHLQCVCGDEVTIKERVAYGLTSEYTVECQTCGIVTSFQNSPFLQKRKISEVNRRLIYSMQTLGL